MLNAKTDKCEYIVEIMLFEDAIVVFCCAVTLVLWVELLNLSWDTVKLLNLAWSDGTYSIPPSYYIITYYIIT